MQTRPKASMMASSGAFVGAHERWTIGLPWRGGEKMVQGMGSLNSHEPSVGLARGHCRLMNVPSGEMDAMVPCLEYAMLLRSGQPAVNGPGSEELRIDGHAYRQHPRLRNSSTRCCSCLLGGREGIGKTSSPNRSSSILGMPPPKGSKWSSSIMGILVSAIRQDCCLTQCWIKPQL